MSKSESFEKEKRNSKLDEKIGYRFIQPLPFACTKKIEIHSH